MRVIRAGDAREMEDKNDRSAQRQRQAREDIEQRHFGGAAWRKWCRRASRARAGGNNVGHLAARQGGASTPSGIGCRAEQPAPSATMRLLRGARGDLDSGIAAYAYADGILNAQIRRGSPSGLRRLNLLDFVAIVEIARLQGRFCPVNLLHWTTARHLIPPLVGYVKRASVIQR